MGQVKKSHLAVVAFLLLVGGLTLVFVRGRSFTPDQQLAVAQWQGEMKVMQAELAAGTSRRPGNDARSVEIYKRLTAGSISMADLEFVLSERARDFPVSPIIMEGQEALAAKKGLPKPDEKQIETFLNRSSRNIIDASLAEYFKQQMPAEQGVRGRFVEHLLSLLEKAETPRERTSVFVCLNVMGELRMGAAGRERALALAAADQHEDVRNFAAAFRAAEKIGQPTADKEATQPVGGGR